MSDLTQTQRQMADANEFLFAELGVGGTAWTVTRVAGDGVTAPVTDAVVGTIAGRVRRAGQITTPNEGGALIQVPIWLLRVAEGVDVRVNDTIQSVADPSYRFNVLTYDRRAGYVTCSLGVAR